MQVLCQRCVKQASSFHKIFTEPSMEIRHLQSREPSLEVGMVRGDCGAKILKEETGLECELSDWVIFRRSFYATKPKINIGRNTINWPSWNEGACEAAQVALVVKNLPANVRDIRDEGSIPGSGGSPGGGHGNPLQCSCLENSMDRGAWLATDHGVTKSQARLK